MELQKLLRRSKQDAFDQLDEWAIKRSRHGKYPNLILFKYHQLDTPMSQPVALECRGVILDEDDNWNVVSRPYDKFWNYGDARAKPLNWDNITVYEKMDGSLMSLYHYDDKWHVASSGSPDASGPVNNGDKTFAQYFWETWNRRGYRLPMYLSDLTFILELCGPLNKVVCSYSGSDIFLHGVRNRITFKEYRPENAAAAIGCPAVPIHEIEIDKLADFVNSRDARFHEGVIIVDDNFNRVKLKSDDYKTLHHIKDGSAVKKLMRSAMNGPNCDYLEAFPEWKPVFHMLRGEFLKFVAEHEILWEKIKDKPTRRDFAIAAQQEARFPGVLFQLLDKKIESIAAGLNVLPEKKMLQLLKLEGISPDIIPE